MKNYRRPDMPPQRDMRSGAKPYGKYPSERDMRHAPHEPFEHYAPPQPQKRKPNKSKPQSSGVVSYEEYSKQKKKKKVSTGTGVTPLKAFEESDGTEENLFVKSDEADAKSDKKAKLIRKIIVAFFCLFFSLTLNIFSVTIPCTPNVTSVDFSALAELIACISVHPIAAVCVIIVKNLIYWLFFPGAIASIPNKIILNTIFILVTWFLYNKVIKSHRFDAANDQREYFDAPKKDYTAYSVFVSGALGSVFTSLISLGTFNIVLMPCVYMWLGNKEKAYEMILGSYQDAYNSLCAKLPFMRDIFASMDSLSVGLFVYNLPITLVKYFLCAAIAAMLTPLAKAFINKK